MDFLVIAAVLGTWTLLAFLSVGLGLLVRGSLGLRAAGVNELDGDALGACLWLGVSVTFLLLQIWHLFLPIGRGATVLVAAIAVLGLVRERSALSRWLHSLRAGRTPLSLAAAFAALVSAFWVADHALGPCSAFDSGMYHLGTISWTRTFPLVPGLGNLHGRLAFNDSSLLFASMLDASPWQGMAHHVFAGFFLAILATRATFALARLPEREGRTRAAAVFDAALLFPCLLLAGSSHFVSSYTVDTVATVVCFALASRLYGLLLTARPPEDRSLDVLAVAALAALAVCAKKSTVAFGLAAWIVALRVSGAPERRAVLAGAALAAALLSSWTVRGVVLSGYPAFPSSFAALDVDWRLPQEHADAISAWIGHFARGYYDSAVWNGSSHAELRFGAFGWIGGWLRSLTWHPEGLTFVLVPSVLAASVAAASLAIGRNGSSRRARSGWLMLAPLGVGVAFWLYTAPRPLFAVFLFWTLFATCAAQTAARLGSAESAPVLIAGLALLGTLPISVPLFRGETHVEYATTHELRRDSPLLLFPTSPATRNPQPVAETRAFSTESGLVLNVPVADNACWNAPLPCTPHPEPALELRVEDDLAKGFRMRGEWQGTHFPNPKTDWLATWRTSTPSPAGKRDRRGAPPGRSK